MKNKATPDSLPTEVSLSVHLTTKVFVSLTFEEEEREQVAYHEMTKEEAINKGKKIIKCSFCLKDAVFLDRYYPWHNELTTCAEHKGAYDEGLEMIEGDEL